MGVGGNCRRQGAVCSDVVNHIRERAAAIGRKPLSTMWLYIVITIVPSTEEEAYQRPTTNRA